MSDVAYLLEALQYNALYQLWMDGYELGEQQDEGRAWLEIAAEPPYRRRFVAFHDPVHDLGADL